MLCELQFTFQVMEESDEWKVWISISSAHHDGASLLRISVPCNVFFGLTHAIFPTQVLTQQSLRLCQFVSSYSSLHLSNIYL